MSQETENVQDQAPEVIQAERKITLWSTKTNKKDSIMSAATTWGELKKEISERTKFSLDGLLATENQKRNDLASDLAVLPETSFVIYFRPKETKSGGMPYKELRAAIKTIIDRDGDTAKDHFNKGKNYTTKSTEELQKLYDTYSGEKSSAPVATSVATETKPKGKDSKKQTVETSETTEVPANNVADVVKPVADAKAMTNKDRIEIVRENLKAIQESQGVTDSFLSANIDDLLDDVETLEEDLSNEGFLDIVSGQFVEVPASTEPAPETEHERMLREEREEDARLAAEAAELAKTFKK